MSEITSKDYDYLAQKLGYESMEALQEEREAKESAEYQARQEAELKAIMDERERVKKVEDQEIMDALQDRMRVSLNEQPIEDLDSPDNVPCPSCGKILSWMRETFLLAKRRASFGGEMMLPQFYRSAYSHGYDVIPTGASGEGLRIFPHSLVMKGHARCPECEKELKLVIEVDCQYEGETLPRIKKTRGKK